MLRLAGEAEATGIDAYFSLECSTRSFAPANCWHLISNYPLKAMCSQSLIRRSTEIPGFTRSRLIACWPSRLSPSDRQERLTSQCQVLIRSEQINDGDLIAATHLPNAVSGLKVEYVQQ